MQSHYRPWRFQKSENSRFQYNRHKKIVRFLSLPTGRLYPQDIFLVLISVRGRVNPRAIVRPEGLCHWKIPMTPSGIEPTPFVLLFVVQTITIKLRSLSLFYGSLHYFAVTSVWLVKLAKRYNCSWQPVQYTDRDTEGKHELRLCEGRRHCCVSVLTL